MKKIDLFNINDKNLDYYLNVLGKTKEEFYEINNSTNGLKLFKFYKDLFHSNNLTENLYVRIKHITTANQDSLEFFRTNGFLNLRKMLKFENSPLRIFLKENDIVIDVEQNILHMCGLEIFYSDTFENRSLSTLTIEGNIYLDIMEYGRLADILSVLRYKLNDAGGEPEFYTNAKKEDIYDYSIVRYCPEILGTLSNIAIVLFKELKVDETVDDKFKIQLLNCYKTLCQNWVDKFNNVYLVNSYVDLSKTNIYDKIKLNSDFDEICNILELDRSKFFNEYGVILNNYKTNVFCNLYVIYNIHQVFKYKYSRLIAVSDNSYIIDSEFIDITNYVDRREQIVKLIITN